MRVLSDDDDDDDEMMADSSQTRILGKVDGQFLHTLMHFGQTMVWDEDDRDAARFFCLLRFSLRLHASLPRTYNWLFSLMSASCLGLRSPAAMTDG